MVLEEVVNVSTEYIPEIVFEIGKIALWLQTLGVIVILWIIFQSITLFFNRKKRLAIYSIKDNLKRVEEKVDKLIKKIDKK